MLRGVVDEFWLRLCLQYHAKPGSATTARPLHACTGAVRKVPFVQQLATHSHDTVYTVVQYRV